MHKAFDKGGETWQGWCKMRQPGAGLETRSAPPPPQQSALISLALTLPESEWAKIIKFDLVNSEFEHFL